MSSDPSISSSSLHIPQNEDQLKQKRKRTTYTIFGLIVALIASTLVESYFLQAEANTSIANNILILAVFNIIIILLFVLIILITRNLIKVYKENTNDIVGLTVIVFAPSDAFNVNAKVPAVVLLGINVNLLVSFPVPCCILDVNIFVGGVPLNV